MITQLILCPLHVVVVVVVNEWKKKMLKIQFKTMNTEVSSVVTIGLVLKGLQNPYVVLNIFTIICNRSNYIP